jgi:hypothetical protein
MDAVDVPVVVPGPDEGPGGGGERLQGRDVDVAHVQVHLLFYRIWENSKFSTLWQIFERMWQKTHCWDLANRLKIF